jgi:hypothetical protein
MNDTNYHVVIEIRVIREIRLNSCSKRNMF